MPKRLELQEKVNKINAMLGLHGVKFASFINFLAKSNHNNYELNHFRDVKWSLRLDGL
jgi:hypothetical protein